MIPIGAAPQLYSMISWPMLLTAHCGTSGARGKRPEALLAPVDIKKAPILNSFFSSTAAGELSSDPRIHMHAVDSYHRVARASEKPEPFFPKQTCQFHSNMLCSIKNSVHTFSPFLRKSKKLSNRSFFEQKINVCSLGTVLVLETYTQLFDVK